MAKFQYSNLQSLQNELSAIQAINNNFAAVKTAFDNTLKLDGTNPNAMSADLDMNSNNIVNVAPGTTTGHALAYEQLAVFLSDINASAAAAAASAVEAEASATASENSATASAGSALAAAGYLSDIENLIETFGDYYLGAKSAHPIVDNSGNPLTVGDIYFNVTDNRVYIYDGSSWTVVMTSTSIDVLENKTIDLADNTLISTSAQLRTALTDETGTGVAVFNSSPTINTPSIGSYAFVTGTSPALQLNETDAASGSRRWKFLANASSLQTTAVNDNDTVATLIHEIVRSGQTISTIKWPQAAQYGFGSTTIDSNAFMHLRMGGKAATGGQLVMDSDGTDGWFRIDPSAGPGSYSSIGVSGDVGLIYSGGTINTGGLYIAPFSDATSPGLRMDNVGNVGIGTASPNARLHIMNGSTVEATSGGMLIVGSLTDSNIGIDGNEIQARTNGVASQLHLQHRGGDLQLVMGGGLVGVGSDPVSGVKLYSNGIIRSNNELQSTNVNQFRAVYGNYGFLVRNDGSNTYFLLTASGDQYGTYNSLRPFTVNNTTGAVSMGNGLTVTGTTTSTQFVGGGAGITGLTAANLSGSKAQFNTACTDTDFVFQNDLAANVATFLATPSSANLAAAVTNETGSGALVFGTSPTLTTPVISSIVNTGTLTLPTSTDTLVGRATTDTLTTKTINLSSNTLSGTKAQFNTACSDGDFVYTDAIGSTVQAYDVDTAKVDVAQDWTAQQYTAVDTLTDGANISWTVTNSQKAKVTLGDNRTFNAVSGAVEGATYLLWIIQDGVGGRTITWTTSGAGSFDFGVDGAPTLSTSADRADLLAFEAISLGGTLKLRFAGIKKGFI